MHEINLANRRTGSSISSIILLAVLFIAAASPSECWATTVYETEIKCPENWQVTFPGNGVTFDLEIRNPSYSYDSYFLYVNDMPLPENWTADFYVKNRRVKGIGIEARQSVRLLLEVKIPQDALPGDYQLDVHADGTYSTAALTLTVTVESPPILHEIELYCPFDWQVTFPGYNLTFEIRIKNLTPYLDNYLLQIREPSLPENWTADFSIGNSKVRSFSAKPQENVDLVLRIGIPQEATPEDYQFRVHVDGKHASATQGITVTVQDFPPIPREIGLLCPFPLQSVLTGQTTYYPIKIMNEGRQPEKVFLIVNSTDDLSAWDLTLSKTQVALGAQESAWITLDVTPPAIIDEGEYNMDITALTEDGELKGTLQVTTKILGNYVIEITGLQPLNPQVTSGDKIDVIATVRNLGQSALTNIRLKVDSPGISNILVTPIDILAIEPMASVDFYVRISPNTGLTPGDYTVKVLAESSETSSTERMFAVSVVSPIPWFWISICITATATALVLIAIQKLISRWKIKVSIRK